jgi:hypothetical protein
MDILVRYSHVFTDIPNAVTFGLPLALIRSLLGGVQIHLGKDMRRRRVRRLQRGEQEAPQLRGEKLGLVAARTKD